MDFGEAVQSVILLLFAMMLQLGFSLFADTSVSWFVSSYRYTMTPWDDPPGFSIQPDHLPQV